MNGKELTEATSERVSTIINNHKMAFGKLIANENNAGALLLEAFVDAGFEENYFKNITCEIKGIDFRQDGGIYVILENIDVDTNEDNELHDRLTIEINGNRITGKW